MKMKILLFGIAREIVGEDKIEVPSAERPETVADLKVWVKSRYEAFKSLKSLAVAVNNEYAEDHQRLEPAMEVALIPPVSGG